jgi:hypothetical protein
MPTTRAPNRMDHEDVDIIIGASGFILYEECYAYNEDACYLADDTEAAKRFMHICGYSNNDFRIDSISINDIIKDYGYSMGEYAMEKQVFDKFKIIAEKHSLQFEAEPFDYDSSLMVVKVDTRKTAQYSD